MNTAFETETTEQAQDLLSITIRPGSENHQLAPLKTIGDLKSTRLHFLIENLSPLSHSEGNEGNMSILMRESVYDPSEPTRIPQQIPCITGNSMRHSLREAAAWFTLHLLNIDLYGLSPAAQHVLMSGGALGKDSATMDVDSYRKLSELFPSLTMFGGGGIGAALVRGNLAVDYALLCCRQNARRISLLCPELTELMQNRPRAEDFTEIRQGVRHDARRHPATRHLLGQESMRAWENERGNTAEQNREEGSTSTQMIYSFESICAGAQWYWSTTLILGTPLEHSLLMCTLLSLAKQGRIGGKGNTGHGRVHIKCIMADGATRDLAEGIEAAAQEDRIVELAEVFAGPYVRHVRDNSEALTEIIRGLK